MSDDWTVEKLVPGGDGFARAPDGRAAFVPGGLPGDRIRPTRTQERKRMVRVEAFDLVEAGPDRRAEAPCAAADRCGGCDWIHLERPAQLHWKREIVADALRRIAHLDVEVDPVVSAGPELGYRSRLRLHVDDAGRIGLYESRSRRVVVMESCPVADPAINQALPDVRAADLEGAEEVELRAAPDGEPLAVVLPGWQPVTQRWPLPGGVSLEVPSTSFVQVNPHVNEALVQALVDGVSQRGARRFLDLYCGAGNFALPLLAAGLTGTGVEVDDDAIEAARRTASGFEGGRFLGGSVADALAELPEGAFDLVILDPPRRGAAEAIAGVLALKPEWIVAVSCDPATLARDLAALGKGGYSVESVTPFDMFPQTHHVEVVAWLAVSGIDD